MTLTEKQKIELRLKDKEYLDKYSKCAFFENSHKKLKLGIITPNNKKHLINYKMVKSEFVLLTTLTKDEKRKIDYFILNNMIKRGLLRG